ncbi:MAG: M48 family metallopeptidase [Prevotella sp.]|nr:M48 family metallopeptidase [Prevotella sp.]MCI1282560.1 M48 family metallopeptidase [Prevotella sp.]
MKYVGMATQIRRNNIMSMLLLLMFPVIILGMVWVFLALLNYFGNGYYDQYGNVVHQLDAATVNYYFVTTIPWVIGGVALWFLIAYFSNVSMIQQATGSRPLTRKENPRIYNIVENLCMSCGMDMPNINIVDDPQLNAFASGINNKSYTVTLTSGIIDRLNDSELAGVIGHELTHIRNRDTRLLITSVIFVGIISTVMSLVVRMMYNVMWFGGGNSRSGSNGKGNGLSIIVILLVGAVCCAIAYFFTLITRFAISRKREYMADAGGAELCGDPLALASALRKISSDPGLDNVKREDVAQLFIVRPDQMSTGLMSFMNSLFSTHPDTEKRIEILEQF